jgi:hypothetical protein
MSVIEVKFQRATAHQNQTSGHGRPDEGLTGTREFELKIGTFPQKDRDGWQPYFSLNALYNATRRLLALQYTAVVSQLYTTT